MNSKINNGIMAFPLSVGAPFIQNEIGLTVSSEDFKVPFPIGSII